jgi:adenylyltransferase/sulfurtransferase
MNKPQVFDISPEEIQRYSRHLVIPEIGLQGQIKLKKASVLIVGCGGLGSPIALYLAAMGIGRIGIVDYDTIELSNLQRQVIHSTNLVGTSKVQSARSRLMAINPDIQVDAYDELFTSQNAEKIAEPYQILIDGTDNIPTRYLLNDLGVLSGKPYVYGAVYRFIGQMGIFDASKGACYRCVFPTPPAPELVPSCSVAGVIGVVPGIIGLLQATEVVKLILNIGSPLVSQMVLYDALECKMQTINVPKNSTCKVCGSNPEITQLIDYEQFCHMPMRDQDFDSEDAHSITPAELKEEIHQHSPLRLIDLRDSIELEISQIPGAENIPFHQLSEKIKGWDKKQAIILICHVGFLSNIAKRILLEAGFENVRNLKGGIHAWAGESDLPFKVY